MVLCWIPILNILGLLLGLAAAVLGVIALVTTSGFESSMKGMAIAALAMGGASVILAGVTALVYSQSSTGSTGASVSNETASPKPSPRPSVSSTPSPSTTPNPKQTTVVPGSASQPLPVGTTALVGKEYQVAITGVKLDATDEVIANNMFNDAPEGRYVLVDIAVTFAGSGEGNPWIDLSPTFVGTDARQYDASSCGASLANGSMKVPTLEPGGSANYQVCMDVPEGAINGGKIFVQESLSFNSKARTYWALQ